jgi:alkanesulfonate monooxygenase SsuD/methylene tetrahydromethanopterin reductase-like flavin-dependent oxidoreductase (luciferase family)
MAWRGEEFEWRGRTVLVTPTPSTPAGPRILIGGKSEIAGRRAARLRLPFAPSSADPAVAQAYVDECAALGFNDGAVLGVGGGPAAPGFVMVSEDPEATWAEIGPLAMHDAETYASWQDDAVRSTWVVPTLGSLEDLKASGRYVVVTPDECVELAARVPSLTLHPLMGGIAPALAGESLELFEKQVLPRLAAS